MSVFTRIRNIFRWRSWAPSVPSACAWNFAIDWKPVIGEYHVTAADAKFTSLR